MLLPLTGVVLWGNSKWGREEWGQLVVMVGLLTGTFTPAHVEKHWVQIKQVPVCEEGNTGLRGKPHTFCLAFFFIFHAFLCHLWWSSCPFQGWSPHVSTTRFLSHFLSLLLSLVMSLSRCESLGYQCSASDRNHMINKLSCFSSPLYPPPFFLKRGLPLLPTTFLLIPAPPPHHPSLSLLFCLLSWMAGSHRCVTIITRTLRKKNNVVSSI